MAHAAVQFTSRPPDPRAPRQGAGLVATSRLAGTGEHGHRRPDSQVAGGRVSRRPRQPRMGARDAVREQLAFEHSANLHHEIWGYLDLHRIMPGFGIDPDEAFEILWRDHEMTEIAGVPCAVPRCRSDPRGAPARRAVTAGRARRARCRVRLVDGGYRDEGGRPAPGIRAGCWTRVRRRLRTAGRAPRRPGVPAVALVSRPEGPRGPRNGRPGSGPLRRGRNARGLHLAATSSTSTISPRSGAAGRRLDVVVEFFARPVRGLREEWTARLSRRRGHRP